MPFPPPAARLIAVAVLLLLAPAVAPAAEPRVAENVLVVTLDGFRWQELFDGADESLFDGKLGGVRDLPGLKKRYWRDTTALLVTTDHGRGANRIDWTSHGKDTAGAKFIWAAVMGPDTPAAGEREAVEVTQSQVAATVAALVGEDFNAAAPRAAPPLPVFGAR